MNGKVTVQFGAVMRIAFVVLLASFSWLLVSCGSIPHASARQASRLVDGSITVGMSRSDVMRKLGQPNDARMVGDTEFLFYQTPWTFALMASQHNPIAIVDGKVAGFGQAYYE